MDPLVTVLGMGQAAIVSTDTVYGLIAYPGSAGENDIYLLKDRPSDQPLCWIVHDDGWLDRLCEDVPEYARRLAEMFWPGPLTLVLKASNRARKLGVAGDGTVGLRCPDDGRLSSLLSDVDSPLCCTSANLHSMPTPSAKDMLPESMRVLPGFDELDEECGNSEPSTVVICTGEHPKVSRTGPIPEQVIMDVAVFGAQG